MKQSKRHVDQVRTNNLHRLTDYMYQKAGYTISRKHDTENQLNGIDIVLTKDNKTFFVDEKAAITAWNKDLQTFALEIRTLNNTDNEGWLFNQKLKTTHYALLFPRSENAQLTQLYKMDIILIDKKHILELLKTYQCHTKQNIFFRIDNFGQLYNGAYRYHVSEQIQIVKSIQLREQPTCIVIDKDILKNLATDYLFWKKNH